MLDGKSLIGLGHPRCGTGYTASILQMNGLDVGHEKIGRDGIVSWEIASGAERVPFGEAVGPLAGYARVFCVARKPLDAMPSIQGENGKPRSIGFRSRTLNTAFDGDVLPGQPDDSLASAVRSYVYWYRLCLRATPGLIFRVDVGDDLDRLAEFVGRPLSLVEAPRRNSRPKRRAPPVSLQDLRNVSPEDRSNLAEITRHMGYDAEADAIEKV